MVIIKMTYFLRQRWLLFIVQFNFNLFTAICCLNGVEPIIITSKKSNLRSTSGVTAKRVTSDRAKRRGNTALKTRRSCGEQLAALFPICPAQESNPRSTAPIAYNYHSAKEMSEQFVESRE